MVEVHRARSERPAAIDALLTSLDLADERSRETDTPPLVSSRVHLRSAFPRLEYVRLNRPRSAIPQRLQRALFMMPDDFEMRFSRAADALAASTREPPTRPALTPSGARRICVLGRVFVPVVAELLDFVLNCFTEHESPPPLYCKHDT
jgi:hypothetical protein